MAIIEVEDVTKEFLLGQTEGLRTTVLNGLRRLARRPVHARPLFKALDRVSFEVEEGEVVGIIGHNGAGKSTLLKLLARISKATSGRIAVCGRIAPLIEVGAGFVPDMTGRENVYLNGSILGMSRREIDRRFDEIVSFAEMEAFIDTPVKRYSSGMQVKLAFAVATSIEAEILIVDEVLAVGDLAFQRKCFDRMEDLIKRQGRTVLLVSHNIRQVERLCTRVLLLESGRVVAAGEPNAICNRFYEASDKRISRQGATSVTAANSNEWATGDILLHAIRLLDATNEPVEQVEHGEPVTIELDFEATRDIRLPIFGIGVHTTDFIYLATQHSLNQLDLDWLDVGMHTLRFEILAFPFMPGAYSLRVGVGQGNASHAIFYAENLLRLQVTSNNAQDRIWSEGLVPLPGVWSLPALRSEGSTQCPTPRSTATKFPTT